jgi:uncharacterized protein
MDGRTIGTMKSLYDAFEIEAVYVFGSRARGDSRPDSDVDVLVVMRDRPTDPMETIFRIRRHIHERTDIAVDVLVSWSERFRARRDQPWTLEHTIATEGVAV